ncbi:MAG TPA: energy transducer TonB, partial [Candidatus Eisenbacteria bacterium]|nr:energy transducer TonB [Candidatus Eisenbacteria bacterium]
DRVPADYPAAAVPHHLRGSVEVRARVDATGMVSEVRVTRGGPPLAAAAADAVRWYVFRPATAGGRPVAAWTSVAVPFAPPAEDPPPLSPDPRALALDAERRGAWREAMDAWTGALERVGSHPAYRNPWAIQAAALRAAARQPHWPVVPADARLQAHEAWDLAQRTTASVALAANAKEFTDALRIAPWFGDCYRWLACALAGSGRRYDAMRALRLYAQAAPDSGAAGRAATALRQLAAGDTLSASETLKW